MRNIVLAVTLIISINVYGQTKLVERGDFSTNLKEKFYVLKSDKNIREGEYKAYALMQNYLTVEGAYKNNLKDSVWKYYSAGKNLVLEGTFKADRKVGIWNAYIRQQVQVSYDYTNRKLLFLNLH